MNETHQSDGEQAAIWNGPAGRAWVDSQKVLDRLFQPFEDVLVEAVSSRSGTRILDVGCGTGGTTLAVARVLGGKGHCTGVDISEPMIGLARVRAEREGLPATFILANAQTHAFDPETFDTIISRFGVMFFDNSVQAFANLRRAATRDAELRLIVWRSASENPFMTTAERAAGPLLPNLPPRRPDEPGQFAFADQNRVFSILDESGWAGMSMKPIDVSCILPEKELVNYFTRLGPVGRVLQDADDPTRAQVIQTVRAAFDPYVYGDEVRFTAACSLVSAQPISAG